MLKSLSRIGLLMISVGLVDANPAQAAPDFEKCQGRGLTNVGTVYFPRMSAQFTIPVPKEKHRIEIAPSGRLVFDKRPVSFEGLRSTLAEVYAREGVEVQVHPSASAQFSAVVPVVAMLNSHSQCWTVIVGNEQYHEVFSKRKLGFIYNPPPLPHFSKFSDLLFTVKFAPERSARRKDNRRYKSAPPSCHVFLYRTEYVRYEASKLAYDRLHIFISKYSETHSAPRSLDLMPRLNTNAIVQAATSTPWSCVGGAIYDLQVAGYSNVDLVIFPNEI